MKLATSWAQMLLLCRSTARHPVRCGGRGCQIGHCKLTGRGTIGCRCSSYRRHVTKPLGHAPAQSVDSAANMEIALL